MENLTHAITADNYMAARGRGGIPTPFCGQGSGLGIRQRAGRRATGRMSDGGRAAPGRFARACAREALGIVLYPTRLGPAGGVGAFSDGGYPAPLKILTAFSRRALIV